MKPRRLPLAPWTALAVVLLLSSELAAQGRTRAARPAPAREASAAQPEGGPLVDDVAKALERAAALAPLREIAEKAGLLVGTGMSPAAVVRSERWTDFARREFSSVTAFNEMKWEMVQPERGQWDFRSADATVVFAEQNGMAVRGHALLMRRPPAWVEALEGRELEAVVKEYITTMVGRYKGRIRAWDVVNEAIDDEGDGYYDSVFHRELGPGFVAEAFRLAHAADPEALLFYNDYGLEVPGPKADRVHELLRELTQQGVPVHGLGLQAHLDTAAWPDRDDMAHTLRRFANLGLVLEFTELDVRVARLEGDWPARFERQADLYRQVVGLCGAGSGVAAITFWGFEDGNSWIGERAGQDAPHLIDSEWTPKPAWFAVHEALGRLAGVRRRANAEPPEERPARRSW